MQLNDYQKEACKTNRNPIETGIGRLPPVLGLAGEAGAVMDIYKRILRDSGWDGTVKSWSRVEKHWGDASAAIERELGDLLWFAAIVAKSHGLKLNDIAKTNLRRARTRYVPRQAAAPPLPDRRFPAKERFPRRLVLRLTQRTTAGKPHVRMQLVYASPNAYPNGGEQSPFNNRMRGYKVGSFYGNEVNDNALADDGYRFHDAIHWSYVANLGWSPTMRGFLGLKRKSNPEVDRTQDGKRAIDTEEAMTAMLAKLAPDRLHFQNLRAVNEEVLDFVTALAKGLEVEKCHGWQWAKAIHEGFVAMHDLENNNGGYLIADLRKRSLRFARTWTR